MDEVEDFFEKSTDNCTGLSAPKYVKQSSSECSEPVTFESVEHSMSENPKQYKFRSRKQSFPKSPKQSLFECTEPVTFGSLQQSMPGSPEQSTLGDHKQYLFSECPEPVTLESANQSTCESPKECRPGSPEQTSSEYLEPVMSESVNRCLNGNPRQYKFRSRKQSFPKIPKESLFECTETVIFGSLQQSLPGSPEQSTPGGHKQYTSGSSEQYLYSECPEPVTSGSAKKSTSESPRQCRPESPEQSSPECVKRSLSANPRQYKFRSRKQSFPIPKRSLSESPEPVTFESAEQSTTENLKKYEPGNPKQSSSQCPEPVTSVSVESMSESPKQYKLRNRKQSFPKSPKQSLSKCPKPVTSKSVQQSSSQCPEPVTSVSVKCVKRSLSANPRQYKFRSRKQSFPIPKRSLSKSPEPVTFESAEQSTTENLKKYEPGNPKQSSSQCPEPVTSVSVKCVKRSLSANPRQYKFRSRKQSFPIPKRSLSKSPEPVTFESAEQSTTENLKKYEPGNPKQSSSQCPEPVTSVSVKCVKRSLSANPRQYKFRSRKQSFPIPKRSLSKSPEPVTFESAEQSTTENLKKYEPGNPKQSSSQCPEPVTSVSVKSMSESPKQYKLRNRKQSFPKSPKPVTSKSVQQSTPGSPEQSSSKCPEPVTSVSVKCVKRSLSANPRQYKFRSRKQSFPKIPKKSLSESPELVTSGSSKPIKCESSDQYMAESLVPSTSSAHANSVQWVVVYFKKENVYSIIPSNWLLYENGFWFSKWPNSSYKSTIEAKIINASEPAKTWKYYAVEIFERYDTYDVAEKEASLYLPSNDQNNFGRGKRKKLNNIRQTKFENDGGSDDDKKPVVGLDGSIVIKEENTNSNSTINSFEQVPELDSFSTCIFKCIFSINEKLDALDKLINAERLDETQQKILDQSFLSLFPMQEVKDIISIDSRIINCSEFEEKFICFIVSLSCTGLKDFVKQILSRLFTNNLATKCTWFGFKGKLELKNLKMIKIINDVSSNAITGHSDAVFKLFVKEWFKHGKKRFNRELNRKSRVISPALKI